MTSLKDTQIKFKKISEQGKFLILLIYALSLIGFGFYLNTPQEIIAGLLRIITSPDTLITDYMGVGNVGSAFVNAGLLALILLVIFRRLKLPIDGTYIACLFTVTGVGFFGKNIFNIWFIVAGVFAYAKYQREPFSKYAYKAFYGTALAPVATEILFSTTSAIWVKISLGISISLLLGFILPAVSDNFFRIHQGFCLYNIGFTTGIVGVVVVALFNSYGLIPIPQFIWTTNNSRLLMVYLTVMFLSMIILAVWLDKRSVGRFKQILSYSGQAPTDFIKITGFAPTLINMGINGLIATLYIYLVGGDFNGPIIGGIITLSGFSAFGKHPINIFPILLGIYLGTLAKPWNATDPSMQLTALFGTNLAPIAGTYGILWGVITGFIHSSVVLHIGAAHGGLNLYNNGFAAGVVAATILPIIKIFETKAS
ncbi:MAG: DUF1576 domain-containing protein [Microcystaceae cyanobacterium]